ncbi:AI-2E family transporter [Enemella evansiae]|uniref:AI-2E family transporter n=1 Tax=Enemella evansiae TaxID=2016499 RepID=A0A255G175_9ACTN|nr:AI-2E family transporter [Enemella evansiae]OYO09625.1 AI-2E family transporter [Enemella evansiae]
MSATTAGRRTGLPRILIILLGLAAALVLLNQLEGFRSFAAPVFLALNLVLAVSPLQQLLVRVHVPRWLAAVIAGIVVLVILCAFFYAIGWSLTLLVTELPNYRDQFLDLYQEIISLLAQFGVSEQQLAEQAKAIDPQQAVGVLTGLLSNLQGAFSLLLIAVTSVFFLMMDSVGFGDRLKRAGAYHPQLTDALVSFGNGVRQYWIVTTIFGLIVAVIDWFALVVLGVPLALVWAVLSFLTNYIPNIGFVIGLVPPALIALLAKGPTTALIVVAIYCVANFVVQSIIQPKFTGDAVGLTPSVVFISLLVWAAVLGPMGALLALPATLLVKAILVDADPGARWVNALIAANPATADADTAEDSHRGEDADPEAAEEQTTADPRPPVESTSAERARNERDEATEEPS